jgi:hypothetical protein
MAGESSRQHIADEQGGFVEQFGSPDFVGDGFDGRV